jgi:peptidoglycan/LPS O-acetylase OafA/YrhL
METTLSAQPTARPEQLKLSRTFDFNLEALRGFAAIVVVWHHLIVHQNRLDPHYNPTGILAFNPPGHLSVLIFFVLSGYVIGRVHLLPLGRKDIVPYIKKRFLRIYPIYAVTMLLGLVIAGGSYPAITVISNLTMTQSIIPPVIFENNPAWSLNFEIVFYLLFIPLSYFRLNASLVALVFGTIGIIAHLNEFYQLGSYALGFAFWLCGVIMARKLQRPIAPSFALMVSLLFLILALERFSLNMWSARIGKILANPNTVESGFVQVLDLITLPYFIMLVAVFASRDFAYRKQIIAALILLPAITFYKRLHHLEALQDKTVILPACFYLLSLAVYFFRERLESLSARIIHHLSSTGAWSYGLYMIHFPLISIFARIEWFSGTAITFVVRLLCYLFLCYAASYFLEKRFQLWVKQFFSK